MTFEKLDNKTIFSLINQLKEDRWSSDRNFLIFSFYPFFK